MSDWSGKGLPRYSQSPRRQEGHPVPLAHPGPYVVHSNQYPVEDNVRYRPLGYSAQVGLESGNRDPSTGSGYRPSMHTVTSPRHDTGSANGGNKGIERALNCLNQLNPGCKCVIPTNKWYLSA